MQQERILCGKTGYIYIVHSPRDAYKITSIQADKQAIVNRHNELRRMVAKGLAVGQNGAKTPKASDMFELKWDEDLAAGAQL